MDGFLAKVKGLVTEHALAAAALIACLILIVLVLAWKSHSAPAAKSTAVGGPTFRESKGRHFQGAGGGSGSLSSESDQPYFQGGGVMNQYAAGLSQYINTGDDSAIHHAHSRDGGYDDVGEQCPDWDGSAAAEVQALVAAAGYLPEHGSYMERTEHYAYNDSDASMVTSSLTANDSYGADSGTDAISAAMTAANTSDPDRAQWTISHDPSTGRQYTADELAAAAQAHSAAASAAPTAELAATHAAAAGLAATAAQTAPVAGSSSFKVNKHHLKKHKEHLANKAMHHAQKAHHAAASKRRH